jgi:hypothetical protein
MRSTNYMTVGLKSCAAALLLIAITISTHAGVIETPPAPMPLPPTDPVHIAEESGNANRILVEPAQSEAYDPVASAALSLVQTVLSLL